MHFHTRSLRLLYRLLILHDGHRHSFWDDVQSFLIEVPPLCLRNDLLPPLESYEFWWRADFWPRLVIDWRCGFRDLFISFL